MTKPRGIPVLLPVILWIFCLATGLGQERDPSPSFGTKDRIQSHIGFSEFSPINSLTTYDVFGYSEGFGRYSTVPNGIFFAHPHVPSGAFLVSVELDYCDFNIDKNVRLELDFCSYLGNPCTFIWSMTSLQGPSGCSFVVADITAQNFTIENNAGQLVLQAETESGDNTNLLLGAYIGYKLQVSPAPATATFGDVPTTSPQFKFVEALVAAGITAGCGGGNYCPDQPVTRGQMAVFLASALGLHWPN